MIPATVHLILQKWHAKFLPGMESQYICSQKLHQHHSSHARHNAIDATRPRGARPQVGLTSGREDNSGYDFDSKRRQRTHAHWHTHARTHAHAHHFDAQQYRHEFSCIAVGSESASGQSTPVALATSNSMSSNTQRRQRGCPHRVHWPNAPPNATDCTTLTWRGQCAHLIQLFLLTVYVSTL